MRATRENARIFEILVARDAGALLWQDVNSDVKNSLCLPCEDVGVDYYRPGLLGQAKYYKRTKYISAHSVDRTRMCAWQSGVYNIEFATLAETKISRSKIPMCGAVCEIQISRRDYDREEIAARIAAYVPETETIEVSSDAHRARDYQRDALAALDACKSTRMRLRMACGSGKTRTTLAWLRRAGYKKIAVLVPSIMLMMQWRDVAREKNWNVNCVGTNTKWRELSEFAQLTIVVYNSWEKIPHEFDFVVVDEAHHVDKTDSDIYKSSNLLLSASLHKHDFDGNVVDFTYSYNMRAAINDGWLVDYDIRITDDTLRLLKHYRWRSLVYFNRIEDARAYAQHARDRGITAAAISCQESSKQRREIIDSFKNNKVQILCSVNTIGEGIDITCAQACVFACTRSSEISIQQCVGRVLRLHAGKQLAHIVVQDTNMLDIIAGVSKFDEKLRREIKNSSTGRIASYTQTSVPEIVDMIFSSSEFQGLWSYKCEIMRKYIAEHNALPARSTVYMNTRLGNWMNKQRTNFARNALTQQRIDMLNAVHTEILHFDAWQKMLDIMKKYIAEHNALPIYSTVYMNTRLGKWMSRQRTSFKRNALTQQRIDSLNEISTKILNTEYYKKRMIAKLDDRNAVDVQEFIALQVLAHSRNELSKTEIKKFQQLQILD